MAASQAWGVECKQVWPAPAAAAADAKPQEVGASTQAVPHAQPAIELGCWQALSQLDDLALDRGDLLDLQDAAPHDAANLQGECPYGLPCQQPALFAYLFINDARGAHLSLCCYDLE